MRMVLGTKYRRCRGIVAGLSRFFNEPDILDDEPEISGRFEPLPEFGDPVLIE